MAKNILSSPILWPLLERFTASEKSYTHELARALKISAAHINRLCNQLEKLGVLKSVRNQNKKNYALNYDSLLTRELLRFDTVIRMKRSSHLRRLSAACRWGVFGSFAEGRQDRNSDLDLWIDANPAKAVKIRLILNAVEEEWGHEINVVYLDEKKLANLSQKDREFFLRLKIQSISEWEDIFE